MKVVLISYNAGNTKSVQYALQRLGLEAIVSENEAEIRTADKIIFPGVGEASSAMKSLAASGLDKIIPSLQQPVLGICLGMQLLCSHSEEGNTRALGIFKTNVKKFSPGNAGEKVPHMGWNTISNPVGKLFDGLPPEPYVYYVHSYYAELCPQTIAQTNYTVPFSAALGQANFYGVQFHPEKSGVAGEYILSNFLKL
jgi:imidazole glycerol-phosphate synthase subunit HisH